MRDRVLNLEGQIEDVEVIQMEVDKWFSEVENKIKKLKTLGTRAQIPTGYMVKTLRSQSTCDSNMPSDQMLSTF